jgi:hypothetical protein
MNPTVSLSKIFCPLIIKDLVVVESVVNKSSDVFLLSIVSKLKRVVLPELVYPTRETIGILFSNL